MLQSVYETARKKVRSVKEGDKKIDSVNEGERTEALTLFIGLVLIGCCLEAAVWGLFFSSNLKKGLFCKNNTDSCMKSMEGQRKRG